MNLPSEYDKATDHIRNVTDEKELQQLNRYVIERLKMVRAARTRAVKTSLSEGSKVTWRGRSGVQHGTVVSIKRKYAHVEVGTGTWRVPMNMLTVVNPQLPSDFIHTGEIC